MASPTFFKYLVDNGINSLRVLGINESETYALACTEASRRILAGKVVGIVAKSPVAFYSLFTTMYSTCAVAQVVDNESNLVWGSGRYDRIINVDIFTGSTNVCKTRSWYNSRISDFRGVEYYDQDKDIVTKVDFNPGVKTSAKANMIPGTHSLNFDGSNYIVSPVSAKNVCPKCSKKMEERTSGGLFGDSYTVLKCTNCGYCA